MGRALHPESRSSYARLADFARYKFMVRLVGGRKGFKSLRLFNGGVGFQFIKEVHLFDVITYTTRVIGHDK